MAKKERTSFTSMLGGNELVSPKAQKAEEVKEEMTRLTLNIPISLKQRMMSYIASTMSTNLSDLTKDAIVKHLDKLEKK